MIIIIIIEGIYDGVGVLECTPSSYYLKLDLINFYQYNNALIKSRDSDINCVVT